MDIALKNRIFKLIPVYYLLKKDIKRQKKYINTILKKDIEEARDSNDGTLDEEDFEKILHYYGYGVPSIVGEAFCTLRGYTMTPEERKCCTYMGAVTGIGDDFFDKTNIDNTKISSMIKDPYSYQANNSLESLAIKFFKIILENLKNKEIFLETLNNVLTSQRNSLKQLDPELSIADIEKFTIDKGGQSLIFYRTAFQHPFIEGEKEALFQLGGLMQMGNDLFDVYTDSRQKIRTLLTEHNKIESVRTLFIDQMSKVLKMIMSLNYSQKNKNLFFHKFILANSRCFVCFDQLEKLERKNKGVFEPINYSRKELICDMEKPVNVMRFIKYYLSYKL